ncbi:acyl carrier protein, partial [Lactobacillus sp. XV13L]|nr:acyl carrier protein [Lactobacillus sp. XV13L]
MTKEEIFTKIQAILAENLEVDRDKITNATNFTKDLD